MIKITALNEESESEDSETEEGVTREALEEIALQQYAKTLELQRKGNTKQALQLLEDLLNTELLHEVNKPAVKDHVSRPLLNLKYLCFCNVAALSAESGDKCAAVDAYLKASQLDDTDVTLWFRLGKMSLDIEKFDLSLFAFQRGVNCNPKHWPCLDNLVTLLLGLRDYTACIVTIYDALQFDSDYMRGRIYRRHIFIDYPYIQEYLSTINPLYKWTPADDEDISSEESEMLIKEAYAINEIYTQQIIDNNIVERLPILKLNKPIEKETWLSLGESLTDMHKYITEQSLSHACVVDIFQHENNTISPILESMEVNAFQTEPPVSILAETSNIEEKVEPEKLNEDLPEKQMSELEKIDMEQETSLIQDANKSSNEGKDKKNATRRRGSSLSFLEQWEWCTKRRSSRKKISNQPSRADETIYDTLKRLIPAHLLSEEIKQSSDKQTKEIKAEDSMDTMDLYKLFEEKEKTISDLSPANQLEKTELYFNTEKETADVQAFIKKYSERQCDIITMVDDFVSILSKMWDIEWPQKLGAVYMKANDCSKQHSAPPLGYGYDEETRNYVHVNLLHLEISIDKLLRVNSKSELLDMELIEVLKMMLSKREFMGENSLNFIVRYLWAKCHTLLLGDQVEFALDCLYLIMYELKDLHEQGNVYSLQVPNFTTNPTISTAHCTDLLKALERNKELSTVMSLYETEKYHEVLSILQGSFLHCQAQAARQEWGGMSLDWAVQLVTLLETLWALQHSEQCFVWAAMCLHEALKHYLLCSPGDTHHERWALTVVKVLVTIEHILQKEGSSYLEILPEKALAKMVQDIVQIIVHQLEDSNGSQQMALDTVVPWILLHYIFQREEDCGRVKKTICEEDAVEREEIPASLMILFTAHDYLGKKGRCCSDEGHLLFFSLNAVLPRLKSPALISVAKGISQCLEQNVFCLFGHPAKKTKLRHLYDHNAIPFKLDWKRSQQIFELFRPDELPEFDSYRLGSISTDTEQLFQRMLSLLPTDCNPAPYYADVISFIENKKDKLPDVDITLPFKMRDIYYLLADFYLKNSETVKALKYYAYDIVITKNRFDSWAGMALARGSLLETKLNSCETFKSETDYLNKAAAVECCFKRALAVDSSHSMLWIEYGAFVYGVHSFCSRTLKQDSESLSMESFGVLETRKEDMLDTAHKCFVSAHKEWMAECEAEDKGPQDERWLHYYMLGKISEKKKEEPGKYLSHYIKAGKFLQENNANYPTKINYNNPQNLSVEALEIHYRIHASILKFMEQHENKIISMTDGDVFKKCLAECAVGPFSLKKKNAKDSEKDSAEEVNETLIKNVNQLSDGQIIGLKRSLSDNSENTDQEVKKLKLSEKEQRELTTADKPPESSVEVVIRETIKSPIDENLYTVAENHQSKKCNIQNDPKSHSIEELPPPQASVCETLDISKPVTSQESTTSTSSTASNSSSDSTSSSDESSSDTSQSSHERPPTDVEMSQEQISEVIATCLESLEDCVSRFPQHYKALYRLAHYHFYYKKDKNVERCRDLMLSSFTGQGGGKLQGLFCERKNSNFFNGIWRIPASEVDRPGSFASHMSRCVLITMEVLKEIDDHKTLLDLCLQLQRTPDAEKKYLRDAERGECSQQALSLCLRSLKGQLAKFSSQPDLAGNLTERKALSNLMLDIYRAYQRAQKHLNSKSSMFSSILIESYKLFSGNTTNSESVILDLSIKQCQFLITNMKQIHTASSSQNVTPSIIPPVVAPLPKKKNHEQPKQPYQALPSPALHKTPDVSTAFAKAAYSQIVQSPSSSYLPFLSGMDPLLTALSGYDHTAAALSYMSNMGGLAGLAGMTTSSYQNDFLRQFMATGLDTAYMQQMKPSYNQSSGMPKGKPTSLSKTTLKSTYLQTTANKPTASSSAKQQNQNSKSSIKVKPFTGYAASQTATQPKLPSYSDKNKTSSNVSHSVLNVKSSEHAAAASSLLSMSSATTGQAIQAKPARTSLSPAHTVTAAVTAPSLVHPAPIPVHTVLTASHTALTTAHMPPATYCSSPGTAKPAHMAAASTVSTTLHAKPPMPHQQVSPGKTLQEKLAERQKQHPVTSKSTIVGDLARSIASTAYSGKIPPSLVITKSTSGKSLGLSSNDEQKHGGLVARPTSLMDTSEVIVLDDD